MTTLAGVATTVLAAGGGIGVVVWLRRRFVLVTIRGSSMQPTFRSGDRVLVRRTSLSTIRPGAVVVFEQSLAGFLPVAEEFVQGQSAGGRRGRELDREWLIKRAVAVPGSPVPEELAAALGAAPGAPVPPGRLAVLGDNRNASADSHLFGYVTEAQVLGIAIRPLSPATRRLPALE
jgi:signal peptidase I